MSEEVVCLPESELAEYIRYAERAEKIVQAALEVWKRLEAANDDYGSDGYWFDRSRYGELTDALEEAGLL
jgi:hypothetical protein